MLAGYFSKAGNSGQIPVDYTEIKMSINLLALNQDLSHMIIKNVICNTDYDQIQRMKQDKIKNKNP